MSRARFRDVLRMCYLRVFVTTCHAERSLAGAKYHPGQRMSVRGHDRHSFVFFSDETGSFFVLHDLSVGCVVLM